MTRCVQALGAERVQRAVTALRTGSPNYSWRPSDLSEASGSGQVDGGFSRFKDYQAFYRVYASRTRLPPPRNRRRWSDRSLLFECDAPRPISIKRASRYQGHAPKARLGW